MKGGNASVPDVAQWLMGRKTERIHDSRHPASRRSHRDTNEDDDVIEDHMDGGITNGSSDLERDED